MLRRRLLWILSVCALVASTAGGAEAVPVVTNTWEAPHQIAAAAIDDAGTIYVVDQNTSGPLILRAMGADGTQLWRRTWRPGGSTLGARDVALGPNGTVLVSGLIRPDPPGDCDDIWNYGWAIAVWDTSGNALWHPAQHGWRTCDAFATMGTVVAGGSHTIAMVARSADEYSVQAEVLAFDLHGHLRWRYPFVERGSGYQSINDLAVGPGGAVYVAGTFNLQMLDEPPTDAEALLEKLHGDGTLAWRRVVPDPRRRDEGAGHLTLVGDTVTFSSLARHDRTFRARVASYTTEGTLRWERTIRRVQDAGWGDAFLASHLDQTVFATTQRDADRRRHILLTAFAADGTRAWTEHLYRAGGLAVLATGLTATDATTVVVGCPTGTSRDLSLVWVLEG